MKQNESRPLRKSEIKEYFESFRLNLTLFHFAVIFSIVLGSFLLFGPGKANAATYYVDNSCSTHNGNGSCNGPDPDCQCAGSDNGDGPFNSIANMQAKAGGYAPDDNIYLKRGETFREQLTVPSSGTSGHPIIFGAYGSGAKPIIAGSDLVSSFTTPLASDTVTRANIRLSIIDGAAFVDFSAAGKLTPWVVYKGALLTITDHTGTHSLTGYIKAAGTTETYGDQLITNGNMETGSPPSNWTANAATLTSVADERTGGSGSACLNVQRTTSMANAYQQLTIGDGALLIGDYWLKKVTNDAYVIVSSTAAEGLPSVQLTDNTVTSWSHYSSKYATAPQANPYINLGSSSTNANSAKFDDVSFLQVLTPSSTGVTITSTPDGDTYNWASVDAEFNRNDTGGYTYTITPANVWQAALTTQPNLVYFNSNKGTQVASILLVNGANKWFWNSNVLYVYSTSDPATAYTNPGIQASVRDHAIYAASKSYITVDGLDARHGNTANNYGTVTFYQTAGTNQEGITIKNCTVIGAHTYGINVWRTNNVSIDANTVSDCDGLYGSIMLSGSSTGSSVASVTNNVVHDNVFGIGETNYDSVTISTNTVYNIQRYGIAHNAFNRSTTGLTITNNEVYNTPLSQAAAAYSEVGYGGTNPYTATGVSVYDNYLHDATKAGSQIDGVCIMSDMGSSAALSPALVYRNRLVNCQGGCIQVQGGANGNVGTKVYDNIMSGCGVDGVGTGQRATVGVGGGATSVLIYNNSSYTPYRGIRVVGSSTATAKNNIIHTAADTNLLQETGSTLTSNYNDFSVDGASMFSYNGTGYPFASWKTNSSQDANSLNADPLFVSTSTPDFHLQSGSPAINAGTDVGLSSDYASNPVPSGSGYDIGAYEYQADTTPDAFVFTDITNASVSSEYTSNPITVAGIDDQAAITITGGTYSINDGAYTSNAGTVANGDTVTVRVTSSASYSTAVDAVLTIGGVSDTYTVTTAQSDITPPAGPTGLSVI